MAPRALTQGARLQASFLHFLRPYYLLHYVGFIAWFVVRDLLVSDNFGFRSMEEEQWLEELTGDDLSGVSREMQIFVCWFVIVFVRGLKARSITEAVGTALFFGKASVCVAAFIADWYLPAYFLAYWLLLFFVAGEPAFEAPNKKFTKMDKRALAGLWEEHPAGSDKAQTYWFINVWASWQKAGASKQFNSTFADLSAEYANTFCRFVKVDAGRPQFQEFIKELQIDNSATSKQVPCLLLFKNGKEVQRLPLDNQGSYLHEYSRAQLEQHFGIKRIGEQTEKLAAEQRVRQGESKKSR
eukprot:TRINITY_DN47304_c0_g1_i1.p1 TRINITY_DN47304_c0_g1~~TRINITY_DN47304_c0_g1_i1.p1  ORF type:complete len:328 (+),score=143.02 TRINITY_DN47304_c0_g1_i1:91-984(+)